MPFLEAVDAARKRHDFCIPQVAMDIRLDTGELAATRHVYNTDAAHRNIETLMVLANMLVSKHLQERAAGTMAKIPQRFHTRLLGGYAANPPATADPIVNSFLAIKSFAQASYQADASGHFGLGLTTYTHFTSPIRRYFDVIIHRILAGAEITDLEEQLAYINERERLVEELQRLYMTWKVVGRISVGDVWPAVTVTKVVPAGIYYLDTELMMDGFIHVSRLGDDGSRWEFADGRLCGSGGRTVAVGDRVACRVDKVDHITGTLLVTALLA
jgi:exoribonuclease R